MALTFKATDHRAVTPFGDYDIRAHSDGYRAIFARRADGDWDIDLVGEYRTFADAIKACELHHRELARTKVVRLQPRAV